MGRPVATQVWNGSTTTGTSTVAYFGTGHTRATLLISNASTKELRGTLQGSMGASTSWVAIAALPSTSATTGASVAITSTGTVVFDKVRYVVSTNATTGSAKAWVLAAEV